MFTNTIIRLLVALFFLYILYKIARVVIEFIILTLISPRQVPNVDIDKLIEQKKRKISIFEHTKIN